MHFLFKICFLTLAWGADSKSRGRYPDTQPILLADDETLSDSFTANSNPSIQTTEFPHHVSLQYNHKAKGWRHFCSASIIDACAVLTTVSCYNVFTKDSSDWVLRVIAGVNNLSINEPTWQVTTGQYIFQHPQFDKVTLNYDFAVIYLRNCFTFNAAVNSTSMPRSDNLAANQSCITSGWDTFGTSNTIDPTKVQGSMGVSDLIVVLEGDCDNYDHGNNVIADTMFCTKGNSLQVRDLGAPLICDEFLTGIMTYPEYMGNPPTDKQVSIFSKVFPVKDWILNPSYHV
ncbi:unnamed protein product [Allacma fusca]|uniref:Peptidase S1 domain-containing protein n=1 Tax=Allacma fusca TaxID=39272 RepID=A0A8J2P0Q1_9HEXA|nr:unnamed protein product [Allacma fusca]